MEKNGEWQKLQNEFRDNVKKHADRPLSVESVTRAQNIKIWFFDPSVTFQNDIVDAEGRVIAKAGTTINPLKFINLHKRLLFFDGDDKDQVAWVKKINEVLQHKTKLILTNGSVSDAEKQFSSPIYFDQEGRLVKRFGIEHVPCVVQQDGLKLKISEVAL